MASSLRVNAIIPSSGTNVAIGTAGGTITYNANVSGVSTFSNGISVGTGASINSPSSNTLKINAGAGNSDAVTIGGGNFLYGVPSNAVYDTNGGANVGDYWSTQFGSPSRGNSGTKVMVGAANTFSFVGFAHTNSSNVSIISSYIVGQLVSNVAGSETGQIYFNTKPSTGAAIERFKISANGHITKPYQPVSCVYGNAGGSVNTGSEATWVIVKFANSTVNRGSAYSSSTGLYTCPVAGVYFVSAFFLTRANAAHNITIYKNGTGIGPTGRDITPSGEQNTGVMAYVDCAANDTLAIYFSNGSGGDFYVDYNYALFSLFG